MNRTLLHLAKLGLSLALIVYLLRSIYADDPEAFRRLLDEPKQWRFLLAAWACFLAAMLCTLARWHLLVRAAGFRWRGRDTLRTGVLAYILDFAALGALGGDLFKALSLRGANPGRGVDALTTVVADRLIGLAMLLTFGSVWIWWHDAARMTGVLPWVSLVVPLGAAVALVAGAGLVLVAHRLEGMSGVIERWRVVGFHAANVLRVAATYGRRPWVLLRAAGLALVVLFLNVVAYSLLVAALPGAGPSFVEHLLIVPLATLSGIVPLPADALGVLDLAMSHLYEHATAGRVSAGMGVMVVMAFRGLGIVVVACGLVYFSAVHGGLRSVLRQTLVRAGEAAER